jgi:CheY-like chemotaxis protein
MIVPVRSPERPIAAMASILLIEDDDDVRMMIATVLGRAGHTVRQAENGVEGLELYRSKQADLVLTDLVMPEKEGLATIMELRRINPTVRIIAMSGGYVYDPKLYLHMATRFGADRVLSKPFDVDALKQIIQEMLSEPPTAPAPETTAG